MFKYTYIAAVSNNRQVSIAVNIATRAAISKNMSGVFRADDESAFKIVAVDNVIPLLISYFSI